MPYPINQRVHQFNSIQSVPVSFGLWDTALKFLSPGPRSDVTDHLEDQRRIWEVTHYSTTNSVKLLVRTRSIFPWLVRVVSDRSVRYNGKHPKFHRCSFLNMQIYGTQNKCLQILFFNNPNKVFCDSQSLFI